MVILYDDSDGWYDHVIGPIVTQSQTPMDALTGTGTCGTNAAKVPDGQQARCGVGPRLPLMVISPFARQNFVDGTFTDQTSVVRFIEDNWLGGERIANGSVDATAGTLENMFDFSGGHAHKLFLDPVSGEPRSGS